MNNIEIQHARMVVSESQTEARSQVGKLIIDMFNNTANLWAKSADIMDVCSTYDKKMVANRIQMLVNNHTLEVDKSGGQRAYKYRLKQPDVPEFVGPLQPTPSVELTTPVVREVPEGIKGRKPKIVWSHDERITLAHEVAVIRRKQPFVSLSQALDQAQASCLAEDRRRIPIGNIKVNAHWLADMVDLVAASVPEPAPAITEPVALALAATPADFTAGQLLDALLDKLADRFKVNVLDILKSSEVQDMLRPQTHNRSPIRHNPIGVAMEPTVSKQKIVVAGLLKSIHIEEVKDKFGDKFKLTFYHTDESVHKLKSMAASADRVLLMVNMIPHKHEEALKAANLKFEKVRGNIGVLLSTLSEIDSQQQSH